MNKDSSNRFYVPNIFSIWKWKIADADTVVAHTVRAIAPSLAAPFSYTKQIDSVVVEASKAWVALSMIRTIFILLLPFAESGLTIAPRAIKSLIHHASKLAWKSTILRWNWWFNSAACRVCWSLIRTLEPWLASSYVLCSFLFVVIWALVILHFRLHLIVSTNVFLTDLACSQIIVIQEVGSCKYRQTNEQP
jgi:hypothetical protein